MRKFRFPSVTMTVAVEIKHHYLKELNKMNDRLAKHIKRKLFEKDEVSDEFDVPTHEQVKYFMLATFEVVENQCMKCYFCKNYKRFTMGSLCKIKPHTKRNCFHFTMDICKIVKKKYYNILITIDETTRGKHITNDRTLSTKTQKNMIYESVRMYEMFLSYKQIGVVDT